MKKLFALSLFSLVLWAQQKSYTVNVSATGATTSFFVDNLNHTVQVNFTGATPSVCTLRLEASLDNSKWDDLSGSQSCATDGKMFHVDGKYTANVRIYVITFTGAAPISITYRGSK